MNVTRLLCSWHLYFQKKTTAWATYLVTNAGVPMRLADQTQQTKLVDIFAAGTFASSRKATTV